MKAFIHYRKVFAQLLTQPYAYKASLILSYSRILCCAVIYNKTRLIRKRTLLTEKFLGYNIYFTSYPQLINLIEEIFIFETYKFNPSTPHISIVDCGSHIGISILYFKKNFPSCHVIAFEPDPESFNLLQQNITSNGLEDVSIYNIALCDAEGEKLLYRNHAFPNDLTTSLIASQNKPDKTNVFASKLSLFITTPIALLKIDTEGSEIQILDDLIKSKTIGLIDNIITEYHPHVTLCAYEDYMVKLTRNGFKTQLKPDHLHPGASEVMIYAELSKMQ